MSTHTPRRRGLIGAVVAGLVASPLALGFTAPADANPAGTGVIISEVFVGGGSGGATYAADYVELFNPTGSSIPLAGMSVQYKSATGAAATSKADLTGSIAAGGYYLVKGSGGATDGLNPDASGGFGASATTGLLLLANTTTLQTIPAGTTTGNAAIVDAVGYGSANAFEGAVKSAVPTVTQSLSRSGTPLDTDNNNTDFTAGALSLTNSSAAPGALAATNPGAKSATVNQAITPFTLAATGGTSPYSWTSSTLPAGLSISTSGTVSGTPTATGTTAVTATVTDASAATASTTFNITVSAPSPLAATNPGNKTAVVGTAIAPFTIAATGGSTPYSWASSTLPAGLTISSGGTVSGTPTAAGSTDVNATVTDAASATATTSFTYTVTAANAPRTIAEIQGTTATQGASAASPLNGQTVTTEGVVTGVFSGSTATNGGIYIQTGGTGGANDATPGASDALYVFGGNARPSGVDIGDSVRVTGTVSEFGTLTQVTPTNASSVVEIAALPAVTPAAIAYPDSAAGREAHESELLAPTGTFTVSNVFNITGGANAFAEIGLATGATPLQQPTDKVRGDDTAGIAAIEADNAARGVALDDGSGVNYMTSPNNALPLPWISGNTNPPRVGAPVTFTAPVVLDYRNSTWKFQPTAQITGSGAGTATFATDRAANAAPAPVGGDLKVATFNVLNYFPTTGQAHVAAGGSCTYFNDRAGNPIANNSCTNPNGPRGAATAASLQRQQDKIVDAINKLGASVVSLEELENSVKMIGQTNRDAAISTLVTALNAASTPGTWAFAPSPAAADRPTPAEEDVIRTGFIYKPAAVELVGASVILKDEVNFDNAREPLAQAFKPVGGAASSTFGVIVNHFKSKGSSCGASSDDPVQGNCNTDRVGQAGALRDFASSFKTARSIDSLFLVGDFNSYTQEDPMQVLYAAGYDNVVSDDTSDASYSFGGLAGSLDHVLGNAAAVESVTGSDIWEINANESLAYQYARYNYHGEIYHSISPWSSSDHNPEVVGIDVAPAASNVDLQVLATNDFHGRLNNDATSGVAGAAVLAGAVKKLRADNPNTTFAAAGDLIGASTFESFIAKDKPTIGALNEAGLEVSAVGNHEFDQGYNDLVNRVTAPYNATTNPYGGASWKYLGANVKFKDSGNPALDPTFVKTQAGVQIGYIGAVTEHLPELVSPGGIANIQVTDIATAVNTEANALKASGVDVIVLLVHEGAGGTSCATINTDTTSDFGKITSRVNANVDAIVSGHTHLAYNCSQPVAAWAGRPVTERPIVSAGQYGTNLNQLVFSVDPATGVVQAKTQAILPLKTLVAGSNPVSYTNNYPVDANTKTIVDNANANAEVLGAVVIGKIAAPFNRAKLADGTTENRGGESTLGNLVAEIQRDQTSAANRGGAQIAFMNPGGLRADLAGTVNGSARDLTYRQAANVQPFANTLVNEALTGAQIKEALEQQWQTNPGGTTPSRPFLKLGISKGFRYTYDPTAAQGSRIKTMTLNGTAVSLTETYSVTVNSFLATGGDNFRALNGTARKQDTGVTDLQAQVDYFAALGASTPAPVDYSQRAVGVTLPSDAPATYPSGGTLVADLTSLSMTGPGDVHDATLTATIDGTTVGTVPVTTTLQTALPGYDEVGTATASITLPSRLSGGAHEVVFTGTSTGTVFKVPFTVQAPPSVGTSVTGTAADIVYGQAGSVEVTVTAASGDAKPTGSVTLNDGATVLGTGDLVDGKATIAISAAQAKELEVGTHPLSLTYSGADGFDPSIGGVTVTVVKATPTVAATVGATTVQVLKNRNKFVVTVSATGFVPTGDVELRNGDEVVGRGTLVDGAASVVVGPYTTVGNDVIRVVYLGDSNAVSAYKLVVIKVTKQAPIMQISAVSSAPKGSRPTVKVSLRGTGAPVTGRVTFTFGGRTATITVRDGKAQYTLPALTRSTTVTARYNGSSTFSTAVKKVTIRLR